jgi:hypothetical protein
VKAKSLVLPSKLITVPKGYSIGWSVKGAGCTLRGGRLYTMTKGKPCTLTQTRTNQKTKLKSSKSVSIKIT